MTIEYGQVEVFVSCDYCRCTEMYHVDHSLIGDDQRTLNFAPGWGLDEAKIFCPTCTDLIERIVNEQVASIRLRRRFKHNPLWQPGLTSDERKRRDEDWQEALKYGLHHEIDQKIQKILGENEGGNNEN